MSLKTQGLATEQGAGVVLATSEVTVPLEVASELTEKMTGARLDRATSPHEAAAVTASVREASPITVRMRISFLLIGS
jgi:hypothetical protein